MLAIHLALTLLSAQSHSVSFSYNSGSAKQVQIAGDFNAWSKPITLTHIGSVWSKSFDLPDDGRIEYKFVVDGEWVPDPANPAKISNGLGGENSVWAGPRYTCVVHDQTPDRPMIRSEIQVDGRSVVVFAPTDSAKLPIMVFGDGPTYEDPGKIQNIVENLVEAGKLRPLVLVLIRPIDRMKEYGADWRAYGHYVFGRVLPAVRQATQAAISPKDLYMGGSSMGGLIALRLAEEFPDQLAGGILCQSAAIQWAAMSLHNEDVATVEKLRQIAPTTKIWLDWGTFEDALTTANVSLTKTLKAARHSYGRTTTSEGHNWTAWRHRMEKDLLYLFNGPPGRH